MTKKHLIEFLYFREQLHGRIITGDELEVFGAYFHKIITKKQLENAESSFVLRPKLANIFDFFYQRGGLGFENEKNIEIKTNSKYIPLGGYKE